jgi:hypothetical protein
LLEFPHVTEQCEQGNNHKEVAGRGYLEFRPSHNKDEAKMEIASTKDMRATIEKYRMNKTTSTPLAPDDYFTHSTIPCLFEQLF